jgi:hypothetical protein
VEQSAAEWQHTGSSAVGEEGEVADAGKAPWQYMLTFTKAENNRSAWNW